MPRINRFTMPPALMQTIRRHFALSESSDHGPAHWARVAWYARQLAHALGESEQVPVLFALVHDSCRENEWEDPQHGPRAEELVLELSDRADWPISEPDTRLLRVACRDHSEGFLRAPVVIQICWDADRLDLVRVGIRPEPARLCTEPARIYAQVNQAWTWARRPAFPTGCPRNTGQPGDRRGPMELNSSFTNNA